MCWLNAHALFLHPSDARLPAAVRWWCMRDRLPVCTMRSPAWLTMSAALLIPHQVQHPSQLMESGTSFSCRGRAPPDSASAATNAASMSSKGSCPAAASSTCAQLVAWVAPVPLSTRTPRRGGTPRPLHTARAGQPARRMQSMQYKEQGKWGYKTGVRLCKLIPTIAKSPPYSAPRPHLTGSSCAR